MLPVLDLQPVLRSRSKVVLHIASGNMTIRSCIPAPALAELVMRDGLYSITPKGFDGVEWPPGGVVVLQNGVFLGGSSFMYYIGTYSAKDGIFKGECMLRPHTPPPAGHLYFDADNIGAGFTGTYKGDQAELTATVLLRKRSLTLQVTFQRLADIDGHPLTALSYSRRA